MILERLIDFHARVEDDIVPASLKPQKVRWFLEIGDDGSFQGLVETGAKKKDWKEVEAPYAKRSGRQPPPYLLVDKPDYVFGFVEGNGETSEAEQAKADVRHAAYVALVRLCAEAADDPALHAFLAFLESHVDVARQAAAEREVKGSDLIAPRVGGLVLTRRPAVRRFWQRLQDEQAAQSSKLEAECMVSGTVGPVARTHPVELVVGPDRVGLVTANENAFLSYGLRQSEIAPMSFEAARKYGEALRFLLSDPQHHLRVADVTWVFWTREKTDLSFATLFKEAEPEDVRKLLKSAEAGREKKALEANEFYALAVSSNTARMVVRSWIMTTLAEVQDHLAAYFQRQRLVGPEGPRFQKLYALAGALVRDFKDLPPQVVPALLENALLGRPLPLSILHKAVLRARAEREYVLTHPRAALIKLVILSHPELRRKFVVTDQLNPEHPHPAYQCGRLLAVLDGLQRNAVSPNATLVDRYYGSASSTPASVFGVLLRNAQNHVSKLRKTQTGLSVYFDRRIGEIAQHFSADSGFPRTLSLEEQGLFALGFYQEKNRPRKAKTDEEETSVPEADPEAPSPTADLFGASA